MFVKLLTEATATATTHKVAEIQFTIQLPAKRE